MGCAGYVHKWLKGGMYGLCRLCTQMVKGRHVRDMYTNARSRVRVMLY